jgi:hypothetical protein
METFWVVVVLLSHPGETHVVRVPPQHYATREACLEHAAELAMSLVHKRWIATRCEERFEAAHGCTATYGRGQRYC